MVTSTLPDADDRDQRSVGAPSQAWMAAGLDVVCIVVFVAIGRSSHTEGVTVSGMASTSWPFLVGAAVGWVVGQVWRRPRSLVPAALAVWLGTVAVGMVLRVLAGQGTAVTFIAVALGFLGAAFFGWRLVDAGIRSLRSRRIRASATGTGDS